MLQTSSELPDIISQSHDTDSSPLQWVGMEKIALPIQVPQKTGKSITCNASVDIFVNLAQQAKGIHMSRLYLLLNQHLATQDITGEKLKKLLSEMLISQRGTSQNAMLKLSFELTLNKKALVSENYGYQAYPVCITLQLVDGLLHTDIELTIPYSSTCPCSASLARQLIAQAVDAEFRGETIEKNSLLSWLTAKQQALATPHNQRSYASVKLRLNSHILPDFTSLIPSLEQAIGTPVQTAVKREDEQAFAKLNGDNLLFCEDAARKLATALEKMDFVADYQFKVEHQESLHPHNAVVIHCKQKVLR